MVAVVHRFECTLFSRSLTIIVTLEICYRGWVSHWKLVWCFKVRIIILTKQCFVFFASKYVRLLADLIWSENSSFCVTSFLSLFSLFCGFLFCFRGKYRVAIKMSKLKWLNIAEMAKMNSVAKPKINKLNWNSKFFL